MRLTDELARRVASSTIRGFPHGPVAFSVIARGRGLAAAEALQFFQGNPLGVIQRSLRLMGNTKPMREPRRAIAASLNDTVRGCFIFM
jgi:hypothetical protein